MVCFGFVWSVFVWTLVGRSRNCEIWNLRNYMGCTTLFPIMFRVRCSSIPCFSFKQSELSACGHIVVNIGIYATKLDASGKTLWGYPSSARLKRHTCTRVVGRLLVSGRVNANGQGGSTCPRDGSHRGVHQGGSTWGGSTWGL